MPDRDRSRWRNPSEDAMPALPQYRRVHQRPAPDAGGGVHRLAPEAVLSLRENLLDERKSNSIATAPRGTSEIS